MILGQDKLLNYIDNQTISTFPKSLLLVGDSGSGKHLLVNYIANKFNLSIVDITNLLSLELITELQLKVEIFIYIIDISKVSRKDQNILLKFIEEPPKNSFIIILCENDSQVLDTVKSRCQIQYLNIYSVEILNKFSKYVIDTSLSNIINTPGKALKYTDQQKVIDIINLAKKIFLCIKKASIPNIMTIPDKISFDDFELFVSALVNTAKDYYILNATIDNIFNIYKRTVQLQNECYIAQINKRQLLENYLLDLKLMFL